MKSRYIGAITLSVGIGTGALAVHSLHAQGKPPAYVIAEIEVSNPDAYAKEYLPAAGKILQEAGAKYIVRGGKTVSIEGEPPKSRVVVFVYDNIEKAQAAYSSAAYRENRKIGEKYAKFRIYAVEGVAP